MAYSGRINYINLADAVETRIKQSVQYDEIVNDLTVTSTKTVPSSELLKVISDKVDNMSSTSVTVDGTVNNVYDLPPAIDNTGKVYVVNGEVFISDGTEWQQQGTIKGDKGEQGQKGDGLHLSGSALTLEELPSPNTDGATYLINGKVYVYNSEQNTYVDNGLIRGEQGEQGIQGIQGEKGDKGLSAYEVALENGFIGTKEEFITSLRGERGVQGIQGLQGEQGIQGIQGEKGMKGDEGQRGLQGLQGEQGIQGIQGERGERGVQGIQGVAGVQGLKGDRGDSFTISKSYKSIEEMNADFNNPLIPEGAFVIISSDTPDTDPDNSKVFIKNGTEYRYQVTMRGLKGETGEQGVQGIQGLQGEQGIQGIQGEQGIQGIRGLRGEQGKGVTLKGELELESQLPITGEVGDAYWVGSRLYIWSDDPVLAVEPTWVRGADLQGVQGIRGEKGEGVADLGTAELLTQAKTIRESINEVFQSGNNVKKEVVSALLSKDNKLTINENSSWADINLAISKIKTGITPIGQDLNVTATESIAEGNFVTLVEQFNHTHKSLTSGINFQGIKKYSFTKLTEGRVAVGYKLANGGIGLSVLTHDGSSISVSASIEVTSAPPSGDSIEVTAINKNLVLVHSKTGSFAPSGRNQIHPVSVSDSNVFTVRSTIIVDSEVDSGNYNGVIRFSDTEFGAIYRNSSNDRVSIKLYTINSTGTTATLGKSYFLVDGSAWDATYAITGENATNTYFTVFTYTKTGAILKGRSFRYDKVAKDIFNVIPDTTFNATTDSAKNQRAYPFTKKDGSKGIVVFHRGASNYLDITYMNVNASNGAPEDIKTKTIVDINGSGYSVVSGEEKTHSAVEISPGVFYVVYKSSTGTDVTTEKDLSGGFIDFNQADPALFGQKLLHEKGRWRFPLLMDFGAGKFGLCVQGGNTTQISFELIKPSVNELVRVAKGNDVVHGIAMASGNNKDDIKIVIPNAN